ncbi:MAG: hypothetical protein DMD26_09480 [Gemmatimonadetes bacterium]|nr:MAG: hypothetical protein DMD26_09480 [Gemmatimonadota bacterium]
MDAVQIGAPPLGGSSCDAGQDPGDTSPPPGVPRRTWQEDVARVRASVENLTADSSGSRRGATGYKDYGRE